MNPHTSRHYSSFLRSFFWLSVIYQTWVYLTRHAYKNASTQKYNLTSTEKPRQKNNKMMEQSRAYPICVLCVWILVPSTLYAMVANMYLISAGRTDKIIRPNSALSLTTVFISRTQLVIMPLGSFHP